MNNGPKSRNEQKQETKEKITDTAEKLFLTNNFDAVSTTQIAEQSGVAKGTIFHHFDNKDKLAIHVLNRILDRFVEDFQNLKQSHDDPKFILKTFLEEMFRMMIDMPGMTSLLLHLFAKMDHVDESTRAEMQQVIDFMMGGFMDEFTQLFDQMGYENPEIKTRILFGVIDGLGLQLHFEQTDSESPLVSELIDEIMTMLLVKEK